MSVTHENLEKAKCYHRNALFGYKLYNQANLSRT